MTFLKVLYYASTALLTVLMCYSASMYFTKPEMVAGFFEFLNYPTYLVYPLATAKLLGLVAIWTKLSSTLKEWAYAGFFYDTSLAATAHLMADDGGATYALVGIVLVLLSYLSEKFIAKRAHHSR